MPTLNFQRLVAFLAVATLSLVSKSEENWAGWDRRIDLPGVLGVGTQYCTASGICQFAGAEQECFYEPVPKADPCYKLGAPPGSKCVPQRICRPAPSPGTEIAADIIAESSRTGSVIVRIAGKTYTTKTDSLFVIYHGTRMLYRRYMECFPPAGSTVTIIGQNGEEYCPKITR